MAGTFRSMDTPPPPFETLGEILADSQDTLKKKAAFSLAE